MKRLEIYINGKYAQISEDLKVTLDKIVSEFRNPLKKTGARSYTIKFPITQVNKAIFDFQNERQAIGKFKASYRCEVVVDGVTVILGEFIMNKVSRTGFEGFVVANSGGRLVDILNAEKKLVDIKSFTPLAFEGDKTVWEYLDKDLVGEESEIAFTYLVDSFARIKNLLGGTVNGTYYPFFYEDFGLSHFGKAIFKNIFADAGYTLEGSVLDREEFRRMILLFSGSSRPYNYAALNLMSTKTAYGYYNQASVFEGSDYKLYSIEPTGYAVYNAEKSGDLSFSLGNDGVYTCKYTGSYTFDIQTQTYAHNATNGGSTKIETKQHLLFREITDSQYTEGPNGTPPLDYSSFSFYGLTDYATLNTSLNTTLSVSNNEHLNRTQFTAYLEEGKQYQAQVYVAVRNDIHPEGLMLIANSDNSWFKITALDGPTTLDPAKFLPEMTQLEFVQAVFKLFNLYYDIDENAGKVILYTRDEWFALNRNNILDLSATMNLDEFEETPLSDKDIADTYFKWASDESDHILTYTDYMDRVNATVEGDVYELPFAPLAFLKIPIARWDGDIIPAETGFDLVPAAIPATEVVDASILNDFEARSEFNYKPKLALYYGAGYLKPGTHTSASGENTYAQNVYYIKFPRTPNLPGGFPVDQYFMNNGKHIPKLAFFNMREQPGYEIELLPATREFRLNPSTTGNIYTENDTGMLVSLAKIDELDSESLSMEGSKSLFLELYSNDLLVTNWSNYSEGPFKVNPVLYEQLNGRNIISVDNELYLLESIKNYEVSSNVARIKLYKLVTQ
ncbi:hypothetical protein [Rufibacter ruber]|uniref:hypothetical protein n=1 Tax=Rufibacter ruber TaxID=1783499 RepID=UPI00082CC8B9|nr:hypothetical protein [Rufibacter ruber]